ncbi:MAG: hypothetical protein JWN07_3183, partial [Hyphomicrobiales bacterium]|nr:hypothetical protein [Hyphomicrobiales bacterium]
DAFETDQSGLEALHREKLLQAIQSPVIADATRPRYRAARCYYNSAGYRVCRR